MPFGAPGKSLDELTLGHDLLLEELVDRDALAEMARSVYDLFRVPLRIFNAEGMLLADAAEPIALYGSGMGAHTNMVAFGFSTRQPMEFRPSHSTSRRSR